MARPIFDDVFNLADYFLFDRLQEGLADKCALRFGTLQYTYQTVADRTLALATWFSQHNVPREHRVYIALPDAPPFAWSLFATVLYGGVVAMGNPHAPLQDLSNVLRYAEPAVFITTPEAAAGLAGTLREMTQLRAVLLVPDVATGDDPERDLAIPQELNWLGDRVATLANACRGAQKMARSDFPRTKRDDCCFWLFTSGSTGHPKAAMHTHRDFAYNTEVYGKGTVGFRRDDVSISVPRLFFGYATGTNLFFPFAVGATAALFSERPTPETVAQAIAMYRPTIITNVPTMMGKLLDHDRALTMAGGKGLDLSCVRFHLSAGEALPPALLERFTERFHNDVYDGIGSAEMFHIYASNRPGDIRPGSLGRVVNGYEIKILAQNAEGPGAEALPAGETGVMWVKGDSVALGYFQDRDKSWATFHGYWCRTGDLFRIDQDGYLWFSGRADDIFKVSGVFVAPLEVEDCLMAHPAVSLAAVIPISEGGLIKPKAFVVLREENKSQKPETLIVALQEHCKSRLSKHKYPRTIEFVDDLPKNDRGKVDRKALIGQAAELKGNHEDA